MHLNTNRVRRTSEYMDAAREVATSAADVLLATSATVPRTYVAELAAADVVSATVARVVEERRVCALVRRVLEADVHALTTVAVVLAANVRTAARIASALSAAGLLPAQASA